MLEPPCRDFQPIYKPKLGFGHEHLAQKGKEASKIIHSQGFTKGETLPLNLKENSSIDEFNKKVPQVLKNPP
ncbi:hypothetical protein NHP20013_07860 [Helicobacter bizzozeronii]|nr:hypothetical protein NHP20013_07860 [Helicobacter bizzozeronii]